MTLARLVTLVVAALAAVSAHAQRRPAASAMSPAVDERMTATRLHHTADAATLPRLVLTIGQERKREDPWFRSDKLKHFFVSFFIQSASYAALRSGDVEHAGAIGGASAVTAGFGLGKELHDRRRGGAISLRDLAWDALGAAAASLLLARTER